MCCVIYRIMIIYILLHENRMMVQIPFHTIRKSRDRSQSRDSNPETAPSQCHCLIIPTKVFLYGDLVKLQSFSFFFSIIIFNWDYFCRNLMWWVTLQHYLLLCCLDPKIISKVQQDFVAFKFIFHTAQLSKSETLTYL